MKVKTLLVYGGMLVLSVVVTVGIPLIAFGVGMWEWSKGIPLKWSSFSFFGSSTNYVSLIMDVIFWYFVLLVFGKLVSKLRK